MTLKRNNTTSSVKGKTMTPFLASALLVLLALPHDNIGLLPLAAAQDSTNNATTSSSIFDEAGGEGCTTPEPTCSTAYYKISDESNGLATSCAAVDQTADPVVGLTQTGCQNSCDGMEGCDTINFRWKDPNFGGESTCYRKNCGNYVTAACTLFSKHKERDVYTKACGAKELWGGEGVIGDQFTDLFAGVVCPDETSEDVANVLASCSAEDVPEAASDEMCSTKYYKLADEFNGQSSSCPLADAASVDPILDLDLVGCEATCDEMEGCDTIEFRWRDPSVEGGRSTCHLRSCGDFDTAACAMTAPSARGGRDVYTKACGAETMWSEQVVTDANGLFAAVECANPPAPPPVEEPTSSLQAPPDYTPVDCTGYNDEDKPQVCVETYYKISDESNGLATSCAAVDQTADPVVGLDQAGCQAACDEMEGCDTINFRWKDPNFGGDSTCYRKNCGDFKTAACTLFSKHKSRDVYTKACGAAQLYSEHVVVDGGGLFSGISCPDETAAEVVELLDKCATNGGVVPDTEEPAAAQSCTKTYYKISDEFNGLATSCAAVDQTADPVVGLDQAGCQASCDALEGCDTINFRWKDPNFNGDSTCYRKNCGSFEQAACTLFSKHKSRDVFTKACGAEELWQDHVLTDAEGLFAGVRCPTEPLPSAEGTTGGGGEPVCASWISTNRTTNSCDICSEWTAGVDGSATAAASVRTCLIWEKTSESGISSCKEYAPSALQLQQREEYNKFLQARWSKVGVCDGSYTSGTTCQITRDDGTVCDARDQPCHGGTELGGVAGVLSAGWQMTFGTAEDNHVCTMCGRGTFGSCEDACAYRRNFFWSGYNLGSIDVEMDANEIETLIAAFEAAQPEETYENPQPLELVPDVLASLPDDHPLSANNLPTQSIYSIISVDDVLVTVRDQLNLIAVGLKHANDGVDEANVTKAKSVLSTSGVKVYETCKCYKCPRGQFQDGLGETQCKSCQDILPGSDTKDTGADGPELCECLQTNDVFLSSDNSQCIHCDLVRSGEESAPPGVCLCDENTYEVSGFHVDEPTWVTCTPCPDKSTTLNAETKKFDYGASIDNCYCTEGTYASEGGCASCPAGKTSPPNAESSSECTLTEVGVLMAVMIPTGLVVFGLIFCFMFFRFRKKLEKLEAEKRRQLQEKVNEATDSVNSLAHPIVLITAEKFMNSGKMVKHEEARAQQCFCTIDSMEELKSFKKGKTLIFFSHQWLAWEEPDPDRVQYKAMLAAFEVLIKRNNIDLANTFVWLDYTSIPQTHRGLQKLSINSLTNYAGACDYFIIVAPGEIYHANTGTLCDKHSYQLRSWCRAEQLAHSCRRGVENMFIANEHGLEPLTWDWIKNSLQVFNGRLTCCDRGHKGIEQCDREFLVTPALGLYCELLAQDKEGHLTKDKKEVLTFFKENEHAVFPPTMEFSLPCGQSETRELFGEILTLLHELDLKKAELDEPIDENVVGTVTKIEMSQKEKSSVTSSFISSTRARLGGGSFVDSSDRSISGGFDTFMDYLKGGKKGEADDSGKPEDVYIERSSVDLEPVSPAILVTDDVEEATHSQSDSSGKQDIETQ